MKRLTRRLVLPALFLATCALGGCYYPYGYPAPYYDGYPGYVAAPPPPAPVGRGYYGGGYWR